MKKLIKHDNSFQQFTVTFHNKITNETITRNVYSWKRLEEVQNEYTKLKEDDPNWIEVR